MVKRSRYCFQHHACQSPTEVVPTPPSGVVPTPPTELLDVTDDLVLSRLCQQMDNRTLSGFVRTNQRIKHVCQEILDSRRPDLVKKRVPAMEEFIKLIMGQTPGPIYVYERGWIYYRDGVNRPIKYGMATILEKNQAYQRYLYLGMIPPMSEKHSLYPGQIRHPQFPLGFYPNLEPGTHPSFFS